MSARTVTIPARIVAEIHSTSLEMEFAHSVYEATPNEATRDAAIDAFLEHSAAVLLAEEITGPIPPLPEMESLYRTGNRRKGRGE